MSSDLRKYAHEITSFIRRNKYERTGAGLYFPAMRAIAHGGYEIDTNGEDHEYIPNILPDEGLAYLLSVGLLNGTKLPNWYLSIYAANYTPLAGLTAASYPATASEITSNTEGYTESTRRPWAGVAGVTPMVDNVASKATFTIATASELTVNGIAMLSESAKGAVTGKIASATKLPTTRTFYNTDEFNVGYRATLTSS